MGLLVFHGPAELLYVLHANLNWSDGTDPFCTLSSSLTRKEKLLQSVPCERNEVTAVISFAWLKADSAVSLETPERGRFYCSNAPSGNSARPIPKGRHLSLPLLLSKPYICSTVNVFK